MASWYLKNLKTGNIQDADEELSLHLGVQSFVDPDHQPLKHLVVDGFAQGTNGVVTLVQILPLLHKLVAHFHPGSGNALLKVSGVDIHEVGDFVSHCQKIKMEMLTLLFIHFVFMGNLKTPFAFIQVVLDKRPQ